MSVSCDGHLIDRIDERVVYTKCGLAHQYFTRFKGRVVPCNGTGRVTRHGDWRTFLPARVEDAVDRLLSSPAPVGAREG